MIYDTNGTVNVVAMGGMLVSYQTIALMNGRCQKSPCIVIHPFRCVIRDQQGLLDDDQMLVKARRIGVVRIGTRTFGVELIQVTSVCSTLRYL